VITRVRLHNFISHRDTDLPLGQGVTVFVGRNGAGKSSVIDGITYALYGEHMRGDNKSLVRNEASLAFSSVEFTVGARQYIVERKLNAKGQLEGSVLKEATGGVAKQLAAGERRQFGESLSAEVAKVIGLDYGRMRVAAIIQQGELDSIVTNFSPKQFKELVNELIGIDTLETAYANMLIMLNDFRGRLRAKYVYDDTNIETVTSLASSTEASLKSADEELGKAGAFLAELRRDESKLAAKVKELEPLREKAALLQANINNLVKYADGQRRKLNTDVEELGRVATESSKYLPLVAKEGKVQKALDSAVRLAERKSAFIETASGTIGTLKSQKKVPAELAETISKARPYLLLAVRKNELQKKLKATKSKITGIESSIRVLEGERARLLANEETAKRLEFKNNICPVCGSHVTKINEFFDRNSIAEHLREHENVARKLAHEKTTLESEQTSLENDVASAVRASDFLSSHRITGKEDVLNLEGERKKILADLRKLPSLTEQVAKAKTERSSLTGEQGKLAEELKAISAGKAFLSEHKVSSAEDVRRLLTKRTELIRIVARIPEDLESLAETRDLGRLKGLAVDEHAKDLLDQVRTLIKQASMYDDQEYNEKKQSLDELRSDSIPKKMAEVEKYRNQTEQDKKTLDGLNKTLNDLRKARELTTMLERIREKVFYRDGPVPTSLRSWALNQIGLKASEYASSFGIGVSSIRLTEKARNISIECYGPRGSVETASLSGGEKVAVALALRFGMAYVMGGYKLDFVILDEPTVHLDPERKASMVDIISGLGTENSPLRQVIVITHDAEIFENAEVDEVYRFEASPEGTRIALIGKTEGHKGEGSASTRQARE
jgi:exonuclease SbcC